MVAQDAIDAGPYAEEVAETWINGNRSDALAAVEQAGPAYAIDVFTLLGELAGPDTAEDFRAALARRAEA